MGHREDLLTAARQCLQERGYARTTARELVAASGTNLASIGYHFGSKDALLSEALSALFEEWAQRVYQLAIEATDGERDPARLLVASVSAIRASFEEYRGIAVACIEAVAQAQHQPELRDRLSAIYRRSREQVTELVASAFTFLDADTARTLASFELAVCDGLLIQWLLDPDNTPGAEELTASLAAVLSAQTVKNA
ncbi:MAG TPA: TetR/AcrR family transcriptional regulator [Pseudonocardia sp.]|nr:TetR/AcrR family transcriptional regulator [Pseudonocardia sp.]